MIKTIDQKKALLKSKTMWVNTILMIIGMVFGTDVAANPEIAIGIMALINMFLRLVTSEPVM